MLRLQQGDKGNKTGHRSFDKTHWSICKCGEQSDTEKRAPVLYLPTPSPRALLGLPSTKQSCCGSFAPALSLKELSHVWDEQQ